MIFNDTEQLSNIYSNITKQATPSKDQLVQQAPVLSRTDLSKDQDLIAEAYEAMTSKGHKNCECKHASKGCDCSGCAECKDNQEPVNEAKKAMKKKAAKPDYMDVDKDGDKKESMKKALKDKANESSKFKTLFMSIINEADIPKGSQFNCKYTLDGKKHSKTLSRSSVKMLKDNPKVKFTSIVNAAEEK